MQIPVGGLLRILPIFFFFTFLAEDIPSLRCSQGPHDGPPRVPKCLGENTFSWSICRLCASYDPLFRALPKLRYLCTRRGLAKCVIFAIWQDAADAERARWFPSTGPSPPSFPQPRSRVSSKNGWQGRQPTTSYRSAIADSLPLVEDS